VSFADAPAITACGSNADILAGVPDDEQAKIAGDRTRL
jgi:hypothetical protein